MQNQKPCVAVAGANGFIGKSILNKIPQTMYAVRALGRDSNKNTDSHIEWVQCDLFNLKKAESALAGVDTLIYLVHSMKKGNKFSQSRFEDLDVIIADNVIRAAQKNNVKQIIYVSGIIPVTDHLSDHLKSRHEVEQILQCSEIPVTSIRSGIIIGSGGSSFQMIYRLVKRLPWMITPKWTQSKSQPVDLRDIVDFVLNAIGKKEFLNTQTDVHGTEMVTYHELIKKFAKAMKRKRYIVSVPVFSLGLSKRWLQLITGMDYDLVSPLVDSLKHDVISKNSGLFDQYCPKPIPLNESISYWTHQEAENELKHEKRKASTNQQRTVQSVQRLVLPRGWTAIEVAQEYMRWLPRMFVDNDLIHFDILGIKLLALQFSHERSSQDRQLFYIVGGLLVTENQNANARLEFRICPHESSVLVAIHDYCPSLPWYLYRLFQAQIHAIVMFLFGRHLKNKNL